MWSQPGSTALLASNGAKKPQLKKKQTNYKKKPHKQTKTNKKQTQFAAGWTDEEVEEGR